MPKVRQRGRAPAPQDGQREVGIFLVCSLKVGRPAALPVQGTPLGGLSIRTRVRLGIRSTWEAETQRRAALVQGPPRRESLSTCLRASTDSRVQSPQGFSPAPVSARCVPSAFQSLQTLPVAPGFPAPSPRPGPCALGMAAQLRAPRSRFWRGVAPGLMETSVCRVRPLHVPSSLLPALLPGQAAARL